MNPNYNGLKYIWVKKIHSIKIPKITKSVQAITDIPKQWTLDFQKVVQISLCQLHTFKHCKLQQFKKKPRLLKTQVIEKRTMIWVYFGFWTCLSERQFNVLSSQNVERLGHFDPLQELLAPASWEGSSPTWLHCSLPLSAAAIFTPEQEPCGSPGPFCLFQLLIS